MIEPENDRYFARLTPLVLGPYMLSIYHFESAVYLLLISALSPAPKHS